MGIEYVEIRSASTREMIGIVDTAKSVIWHRKYYSVGDFEIYAPCTPENITVLTEGNYVTRFNDPEVGIIESLQVTYDADDGRMIVAKGRFAKSIIDRRIIYKLSGHSVSPTVLRGKVEDAARSLVTQNAISCSFDSGRNIPQLVLGAYAGYAQKIVDDNGYAAQKQVTHSNLLTYSDSLLEEYGMGAYCLLNSDRKLAYTVFRGADRSVDNSEGNGPVVFSQDFDNLLSSEYLFDSSNLKNTALIGGTGEGEERFHSILKNDSVAGLDRREIFVDASSTSKTYKDESDVDQTFTDDEYNEQLITLGRQNVAKQSIVETFDGDIDLTNGSFLYGRDFNIGDIVTVQDVEIGLYINPRILEITEVQDEDGYQISAKYGK